MNFIKRAVKMAALAAMLSTVVVTVGSTLAFAADKPYTAEALKVSQKNDEKILLHFHADWCPTCKAQKKELAQLEQQGLLKGISVYTVDYDKETEFKKQLGVTAQSTFVAYYGGVETGRASGITSDADVKAFINDKLIKLTLADELTLMREASAKKIPADKLKILTDATDKLRSEQLAQKALKVGQKMPDFTLKDARGTNIHLKDQLKNGAVIVTFYRGNWCPYCNAQLNAFQQHLADFKAAGAQLIAVTPEKPDLNVLTQENKKLEFPIVSDTSNKLAKKFGLVFAVTGDLKDMYQKFGVDLEKSQGNDEWKLPVPATYIVNKSGKVVYAFVEPDYTKRATPEDVLAALKTIKQ